MNSRPTKSTNKKSVIQPDVFLMLDLKLTNFKNKHTQVVLYILTLLSSNDIIFYDKLILFIKRD